MPGTHKENKNAPPPQSNLIDLRRSVMLASLRGFETPVAGHYQAPLWLTAKERATLPPAFDSNRGGPIWGGTK